MMKWDILIPKKGKPRKEEMVYISIDTVRDADEAVEATIHLERSVYAKKALRNPELVL